MYCLNSENVLCLCEVIGDEQCAKSQLGLLAMRKCVVGYLIDRIHTFYAETRF